MSVTSFVFRPRFSPHRMHACRMRARPLVTDGRSVSLSDCDCEPCKTAEPMEMPVMMWTAGVSNTHTHTHTHTHV